MKTAILILFSAALSFGLAMGQNQIIEAEYYFDQDPGFGNANPIDFSNGETISLAFGADFGDLDEGTYFAYVRVKDETEMWSVPVKVPFRVQKSDLPDIASGEWYIDNDPGFGNANQLAINQGELVEGLANASTESLTGGRHLAYLRFQNGDGSWSLPIKKPFIVNDKVPLNLVAAEYFIDEDPGIGEGVPVDVDPDHFVDDSFTAEVAEGLPLGDHFLYTRVQNENDIWSLYLVRSFSVGELSTHDGQLLRSTRIFPIPTRDFLYVENDEYLIKELRLLDMTGQLVQFNQIGEGQLDLRSLATGTYLLRIKTDQGSITKKIILQ